MCYGVTVCVEVEMRGDAFWCVICLFEPRRLILNGKE